MGNVAVICDSTCDLPQAQMEAAGVRVVPLKVVFGPESFLDGVEMSADQFWVKLRTSPHHPKTSQPSPGDFLTALAAAKAAGASGAVVITLSAGLSGTHQSAVLAASSFTDFPIKIVDTKLASGGMGLLILEAAALAAKGASLDEVAALAERRAESALLFVIVDSLDWLQKNGRIGRATALVGALVSLKPVLAISKDDGLIEPVEKIRGRARSLARLSELVAARIPAGSRLHLAVMHGDCEAEALAVQQAIAAKYEFAASYLGSVGAVIGTNVGPGAVGVILYPD